MELSMKQTRELIPSYISAELSVQLDIFDKNER